MSETNVGWSRSAQDAAEARDATETPLLNVPRPQGLDRRVGYVTMRWVTVIATWFGVRLLGALNGFPTGVTAFVGLLIVLPIASLRIRSWLRPPATGFSSPANADNSAIGVGKTTGDDDLSEALDLQRVRPAARLRPGRGGTLMFGFRRRRRKQKFDDYTLDWIANLGDDCPKCSHRLRLESDRGDGKPEAYCDACGYGENPWYSWKQTECPKCTDPHAVEQVGQGNYFLDCDRCSHREYSIS